MPTLELGGTVPTLPLPARLAEVLGPSLTLTLDGDTFTSPSACSPHGVTGLSSGLIRLRPTMFGIRSTTGFIAGQTGSDQ